MIIDAIDVSTYPDNHERRIPGWGVSISRKAWDRCVAVPKEREGVSEEERVGDLLDALPRHETGHGALLIDILDVLHGASIAKDRPVLPPAQELTPTELRVLRFLPTNMSRTEIARELYLSVNTVNTHVRSIYAKLDARDRSTAVERARELRLIASRSVAH